MILIKKKKEITPLYVGINYVRNVTYVGKKPDEQEVTKTVQVGGYIEPHGYGAQAYAVNAAGNGVPHVCAQA